MRQVAAGSRPVRVGNAPGGQMQYDALGMVVEAVSVYVQTGGPLDDETWEMVTAMADSLVAEDDAGELSHGIWELRRPLSPPPLTPPPSWRWCSGC